MISTVNTLTFKGLDIIDVQVQVHMANGLPAFNIVGYRIRLLVNHVKECDLRLIV